MPGGIPYWRLSAFYFCFFAALGALAPYWGPYLRARGFEPARIGELVAILHATKIIAPNIWGWVADHTGRGMGIVRVASLVAMVAFAGVLFDGGYWWMAAVMATFSFFWNAALPQFEANTFNHLGAEHHRYSHIRLWGSIGFIVTVILVGEVTDRQGMAVVPWIVMVVFAGLWVASLTAPEAAQSSSDHDGGSFLQVFLRPQVLGFFGACFFIQVSHGPFYAFYSIYLEDHGYTGSVIGGLWALGVIAEVMVFLVVHRLLVRFSPRQLMMFALGMAAVRWSLVATYPEILAIQGLAQLMHAATFGVYHAVSISLVNRFFVGPNQGRGQALYSSLTFGAGVAIGSLLSGRLWTLWGESATFYAAAGAALIGLGLAARSVPAK